MCEEFHINRTEILIRADVRFGSNADTCAAKDHVRFTPKSDRDGGLPQNGMSALPSKADMCSATADVCFGHDAFIKRTKYAYILTCVSMFI